MKYQMMADESFVDKLNESITYKPGDVLKTEINENRKNDLVVRKLAHVVKEIDTTEEAKKKAEEEAAKKLAEEEEAKKKAEEDKKKASNSTTDKK